MTSFEASRLMFLNKACILMKGSMVAGEAIASQGDAVLNQRQRMMTDIYNEN